MSCGVRVQERPSACAEEAQNSKEYPLDPSKTSPRLKQTQSLDDTHITPTMAGYRRRSFYPILSE